ncbi:MAG: zf-HC2 domain-containing protein [Acidobacteria bacterium]|nr:zf-HC2 domain-containing protein [Acidobacteriota bacterium]
MDCRKCAEDMTAFMDGEISPSHTALMQSHIDACPACAEEYASLRKAADLVQNHHRYVDLTPGSWNLLHARIGPESRPSIFDFFLIRRWSPVMAMALAGLALIFGLWSYHRYQESERALRSYMAEYIRVREARTQAYHLTSTREGRARFEYLDLRDEENPFVVVHGTTEDNPFRK